HAALKLIVGDPVAEPQRLEEILVNHVRAGRDDRIDHVVADHVHENLLEPGTDERAGQAKDDAAFAIAKHAVINIRGAMKIARREFFVAAPAHKIGLEMDREQTIRARARMALRAEQAFGLRSLPLRIVEQKDVLENETPATSKSEPARVGPVACDPVDLFGKP